MKNEFDLCSHFLYETVFGRVLLKLATRPHAERRISRFLRSTRSRPFLLWFAKRHDAALSREELLRYHSFRDFFIRESVSMGIDITPDHLISPCDGFLSLYPITEKCSFPIKGSRYRLSDLVTDEQLEKNYIGGTCLVFRLSPADCHRFCYFDDGYQGRIHPVQGSLSIAKPLTDEKTPVFVLNRRSWCLISTEHFGPVVQTEIGALTLGRIVNKHDTARVFRGYEKGHFELAGSSIVLLFEKDRIALRPELKAKLEAGNEARVEQGKWIAVREKSLYDQYIIKRE